MAERKFPKIRVYIRYRHHLTNTLCWRYGGSTTQALSTEAAITMWQDLVEYHPRSEMRAELAEQFGYYIED